MVSLSAFLAEVRRIVEARPTYRLGGDGRDGTCDCIGLIIGAIRKAGGTWPGIHGSNWAARNWMDTLASPPPIESGGIVYKARAPGAAGYSLPSGYLQHPDQRDYYHVGVITETDPLNITHCTSAGGVSGIVVDTKLGAWKYGGRGAGIDYEGGDLKVYESWEGTVVAASGSTVRLRAAPSETAVVLQNVPLGTRVQVTDAQGAWYRVQAAKTGWMMQKHVEGGPESAGWASTEEKTDCGVLEEMMSRIEQKLDLVLDRLAAAE